MESKHLFKPNKLICQSEINGGLEIKRGWEAKILTSRWISSWYWFIKILKLRSSGPELLPSTRDWWATTSVSWDKAEQLTVFFPIHIALGAMNFEEIRLGKMIIQGRRLRLLKRKRSETVRVSSIFWAKWKISLALGIFIKAMMQSKHHWKATHSYRGNPVSCFFGGEKAPSLSTKHIIHANECNLLYR